MKNEKLITLMNAKGISRAQLEISHRANGMNTSKNEPELYEQLTLDLLNQDSEQTKI